MPKVFIFIFFFLFTIGVHAQVYVVNADTVYYYNESIDGADAATFDIIYDSDNQEFARDKNAIYYRGEKTAYDVKTFTIHPEWRHFPEYLLDANDIYINNRELGFVAMGVSSPTSFTFLHGSMAVDDTSIYWDYQRIIDSDAKTLSMLYGNLYKDKNHVYYEGYRLPLAPDSLKLISFRGDAVEFMGDSQMVCDDSGYCYQMDVSTFEYINFNYAKDSQRVLGRNVYLKADPSTFEVPNPKMEHYARDKNHQFYLTDAFPDVVADKYLIDDEAFRGYYELVKEKLQHAFKTYQPPEQMEVESALQTIYTFPDSKDTKIEKGDYIFMNGIRQTSIDAATFEIFNNDYAKDKNSVYLIYEYENEVSFNRIANADPKSFSIIENPYTAYSRDANNVYMGLDTIENADPDTFRVVAKQHAEDKNSVFLEDKQLQGLKPQKDAVMEKIAQHYYSYGTTIFYKLFSYEKVLENVTKSGFKVINAYYASSNGSLMYQGRLAGNLENNEVITAENAYNIRTSKGRAFSYGQPILKNKIPLLRQYGNTKYTTDDHTLFYDGTPIAGVNLSQLHHANGNKQYITFSTGKALFYDKVIDIDVDSFEEYKWLHYAKDKNHVYYNGEKTEHDPKTFFKYNGDFTSDKNGVYFLNKLLPEADSETFNVFYDYGFDKNNFYFRDRVIPRTAVDLKK